MFKIEFHGIVGRQIIVIIVVLIRVVTIIVILIRVVTIIVLIIIILIRVVIFTQVVITLIITLVVILVVIPSGKRYRISSGYRQRTTTKLFHQYGPPLARGGESGKVIVWAQFLVCVPLGKA